MELVFGNHTIWIYRTEQLFRIVIESMHICIGGGQNYSTKKLLTNSIQIKANAAMFS